MFPIPFIWTLAFFTLFTFLVIAFFQYRQAWRAYARGDRSTLENMPPEARG